MTILWLVVLPLVIAVVVLVLRGLPIVVAPLSAATLIVMAIMAVTLRQAGSLLILGRAVGLLPQEAIVLAFDCVLIALILFYSYRVPLNPLTYPLTLVAMGLFAATMMVRNTVLATLLFEVAAVAAALLIPSRRPGAALTGMRVLVLLVLAAPLLLIGAWTTENPSLIPASSPLLRASGIALAIGFGIGLAVVPFQAWLPPVFRYGSPVAGAMLTVVLGNALLLRISTLFQASLRLGGTDLFATLLVGGGLITAVAGGLMALPQRSVSHALAYAAIADLGIALLGLGLGSETGIRIATLHLIYRAVGIVVVSMALGILRTCLDGDEETHLRGAFRRAPLAILSVAIGGFSLAGLPFSAGFSSRLVLYRTLANDHVGWTVALIMASIGPAWAFLRCVAAALFSSPVSGTRREPFLPGALTLLLGLVLLALGIYPQLLTLLPEPWLLAFFSSALTPLP